MSAVRLGVRPGLLPVVAAVQGVEMYGDFARGVDRRVAGHAVRVDHDAARLHLEPASRARRSLGETPIPTTIMSAGRTAPSESVRLKRPAASEISATVAPSRSATPAARC